MVNRELATCTDEVTRLRALGHNHALWSILIKDLALGENILPDGVKHTLIGLGLWSMRYSTTAILNNLPVQPLIEVNRNIVDGLLAQATLGRQAEKLSTAALSI